MNYFLGASGLIGTAISSQIKSESIKIVSREEYETWNKLENIDNYIDRNGITQLDRFFVCSGITDPSVKLDQIQLHNLQIPLAILEKSKDINFQVVTFGSIQENSKINNPYIQSKKEFLRKSMQDHNYGNHLHFQLHTAYGLNKPKDHMLLGRFLRSIRFKEPLEMSSGDQYREYWHTEDIANFVVSRSWSNKFSTIIPVSSGQPIKIGELARQVFEYFSVVELLTLGAIRDDPCESYDRSMFTESFEGAKFMRNPIENVIKYLDQYRQESKA